MFEKTRLRLVLLNSAVFLLILCMFGTILYFYMEYRLDRQVDKTIQDVKSHIMKEHYQDIGEFIKPENNEENHRIVYLFFGNKNEILEEMPKNLVSKKDVIKLSKEKNHKVPITVKSNHSVFRSITFPINKYISINGTNKYVDRIQLIYNMEREKEMLMHLLVFIEFASIVSIIISFIAGFFLANKALVPIRLAWNKQSQFAADASHELRTPLTVMKLNLERLFRHPKNSVEQESINISQTINEINYMTKMITNLLTLARSESNQLELMLKPIELNSILNKVVLDFTELAKLRDIKIISDILFPIYILGDEERLQQLLMIIMGNSLKYTKKGTISVNGYVKGSTARISISDSGVGISQEDLPFIFDRFYRGDKARTRTYEGTGLGLSIAKWITESHGGKIRATSEMGKGSQFMISFPINKKKHN